MTNLADKPRVVILAVPCEPTTILYNAICEDSEVLQVIFEAKEKPWDIVRRRARRLGWWRVIGQVLFQVSVQKILSRAIPSAMQRLSRQGLMKSAGIPESLVKRVDSANEKSTIALINSLRPEVLLINGTRILSKTFLDEVHCPVVNVHAGITPCYRGVHGAYWALASGDTINCGVTIHLVDQGIDTGGVIYQQQIAPGAEDNFSTYPLLQFAAAAQILPEAIRKVRNGEVKFLTRSSCNSALWYHPTLWQYLYYRIFRNVR